MNADEEATFILKLKEALQPDDIAKQVLSSLQPVINKLEDAITRLSATNSALRKQVAERDETISRLQHRVDELEVRCDDLEQKGRKCSIRVFGLPEEEEGRLEDKILRICNENLKLRPPVVPEEIEVVPVPEDDSREPPKPRPVLVKLSSRRTKAQIMEECKLLKDNPYTYTMDNNIFSKAIYIGDDLTKRRANLAYQARLFKRNNAIKDTWVSNCKILVKNKHNRISQVNSLQDL